MNASPRAILDFWFKETDAKFWFAEDAGFDARIRERFLSAWTTARDGGLQDWKSHVDGALALVILFDQFSRNMFRGKAEAFSADALARAVADRAIRHHFDLEVPKGARAFSYMPFMHSENLADQDHSLVLFAERVGRDSVNYPYAVQHRDIIARFGRFPARNAALGRKSTPDELEFLKRN